VCSTLGTKESDIAGVMLSTTIGATRNIDSYTANLGEPFFFERFANGLCQTA